MTANSDRIVVLLEVILALDIEGDARSACQELQNLLNDHPIATNDPIQPGLDFICKNLMQFIVSEKNNQDYASLLELAKTQKFYISGYQHHASLPGIRQV